MKTVQCTGKQEVCEKKIKIKERKKNTKMWKTFEYPMAI